MNIYRRLINIIVYHLDTSVVDPRFPVGGVPIKGGVYMYPKWALFAKNVRENKRIGSHRKCAPSMPPRSTNAHLVTWYYTYLLL